MDVSSFSNKDLKVYPNPVKDILHLSSRQTITNVAVFNLLGQKVIDTATNDNNVEIVMSSLPSGNYIVKVVSGYQIDAIKIIIE